MKKIIFIAWVLLCSYANSEASSKTPTEVIASFNKKFPNATKVTWDKENAHEYEAEFYLKNVKYSANYSDTGEWLETESPFNFNQLPEKVLATYNKTHKNSKVKDVSKIETSKGKVMFEIEIANGLKTVELFYTEDGIATKE